MTEDIDIRKSQFHTRKVTICRLCGTELELFIDNVNGCFKGVQFKCPKHGTLGKGERYLTGYR